MHPICRWLACFALTLLASCGGDGSSSDDPAPDLTLFGTAADAGALSGAAVIVKCATQSARTVTAADGSYSVSLTASALPCIIQVSGSGGVYHAVFAGSGPGMYRVNASPLTELVVARLAAASGRTPVSMFAEFDAARTGLTSAIVAAALDYLRAALAGLVDLNSVDPMADVMVAGDVSTGGNVLGAKVFGFLLELSAAETTLDTVATALAVGTDTAALAPKISGDPTSLAVESPKPAAFSVLATSVLKLAYQWQVSADGGANYRDVAGATGDSFALATTDTSDSGKLYRIRVSNANAIRTSAAATLTVNPAPVAPSIDAQPVDDSVVAPAAATFRASATGVPAPSFQWQRSNDGGTTYADIGGATAAGYTTPPTTVADDGTRVRVVVANASGTAISDVAVLHVSAPPAPPSPPVITTQPQDTTVAYGQAATFSVSASSTSAPSYQWSRGGVAIIGATGASYTAPIAVAGDNGATFAVTVVNASGSTASASAALTVTGIPAPAPNRVAAGTSHSVSVRSDGSVLGWGNIKADIGTSLSGLMGIGNGSATAGVPTLARNVDGTLFGGAQTVAAGQWSTLVLKTDGTVWGWGYSGWGNLGTSATFSFEQKSPVQVKLAGGSPLTSVVKIAVGYYSTSMAVTSDGTVWGWGQNRYGQLGIGSASETGQYTPMPMLAPSGSGRFIDAVQAAPSTSSAAVLKRDGTVYAVGWGDYGTLGDGTTAHRTWVPTRVETAPGVALTGIVSLAAGAQFFIAVTSAGTAYAWGDNSSGQLGDGTLTTRTRPVLVTDATGMPLTGLVAAAAGRNYSVLLESDGTVWSVGANDMGQLGTGNTATQVSTPAVVKDVSGAVFGSVVSVSALDSHTVVRRGDGSVWTWGSNVYLQLGDMTTANRPNPVLAQPPSP